MFPDILQATIQKAKNVDDNEGNNGIVYKDGTNILDMLVASVVVGILLGRMDKEMARPAVGAL